MVSEAQRFLLADMQIANIMENQLQEYKILHRKVEPSKKGRGVVTPNLRAFCTMVPKRCRETCMNMYYENEQACEAIHMPCVQSRDESSEVRGVVREKRTLTSREA